MFHRHFASKVLSAAVCFGWACPTLAVDGVVLIDQSRALAGGVTAGDTPGFPVTITQSGSYRLASDLNVGALSATSHAVEIVVPVSGKALDVRIDLNGFSLRGVDVCTVVADGQDGTLNCTGAPGQTFGVASRNNLGGSLTVVNGTVRGFSSGGVLCNEATCRIEGLRISNNGQLGIWLTGSNPALSSIVGNLVYANGGNGIVGGAGVVQGNVVRRNKLDGIAAGGLVSGNTVAENGRYGLSGNAGYVGNVFYANGLANIAPFAAAVPLGLNQCGAGLCP